MSFDLNAVEIRVLGCLLEKERLTPENYPLSLHSLTVACNQSTSRDPVVSYDEKTVEAGVNALREKKLATAISGAGSRVQKYRHKLLEHYSLDDGEVALICVLLLRGPQTPGELRVRTERMSAFSSLEAVEVCLGELGKGDASLVRLLPPRPGQKEKRYVQLLSSESLLSEITQAVSASAMTDQPGSPMCRPPLLARQPTTASPRPPPRSPPPPRPSRTDELEKEMASLKMDLQELRKEFAAFRKQFE